MLCKRPDGLDATLVSMQTKDRLRTLERLRDRLAEEIDATDSLHNLERLAARLQCVTLPESMIGCNSTKGGLSEAMRKFGTKAVQPTWFSAGEADKAATAQGRRRQRGYRRGQRPLTASQWTFGTSVGP